MTRPKHVTRPQFAEKLRAAQAAKGLTAEQLARQIDRSLRLVQKWRAGDSVPSFGNVVRLSRALDVPIDYFAAEPNEVAA
jgi:transcriptional regulator with XRE-family HTH domain